MNRPPAIFLLLQQMNAHRGCYIWLLLCLVLVVKYLYLNMLVSKYFPRFGSFLIFIRSSITLGLTNPN